TRRVRAASPGGRSTQPAGTAFTRPSGARTVFGIGPGAKVSAIEGSLPGVAIVPRPGTPRIPDDGRPWHGLLVLGEVGLLFLFENPGQFTQQSGTIAPKGTAVLAGERRGGERCQTLQDGGGLGGVGVVVHRLPHRFAGRED